MMFRLDFYFHRYEEALMPTLKLVADFSIFPDDTKMGPDFNLSGFRFTDVNTTGTFPSFVNDSGERGLQFHADGLTVTLPLERDAVSFRWGAFAGACTVNALDKSGNVISSSSHAGAFKDFTIKDRGIAALQFKGGGNEAALPWVSVEVVVA